MKFKTRLKPQVNVELVPMIDVVFQLVVFFMVSSTFIVTPGINIELPQSQTAEPVVMSKLIVTIISEEEIYMNKTRYTLESFAKALQNVEEQKKREIRTIVIEADRNVPYSLMIQTMDVLRKNGFRGINLRTLQRTGERE